MIAADACSSIFDNALNDDEPHSQKSVSEEWLIPRSTLNSTIKSLESEGYVTLEKIPGKRRECNIRLTDAGRAYAARSLEPLYAMEEQAMRQTVAREGEGFVDTFCDFSEALYTIYQESEEA